MEPAQKPRDDCLSDPEGTFEDTDLDLCFDVGDQLTSRCGTGVASQTRVDEAEKPYE